MKALSIAATGMNAQQTNLEVIANNIANINTTGFKRARAEFSDLLYQTERLQGVPEPRQREHRAGRRQHRPRRQDHGDPQPAHPGLAGLDRQQVRPGADRHRLVPDRRRRRRDALHPRRRVQHQRQRRPGDRRRLCRAAGHHRAGRRGRDRRQQDRPGVCAHRRPDRAAGPRPADAGDLRQRGRPGAARRQSVPGNRGVRPGQCRRARRSRLRDRRSRATSKTPTSIRSRRSPS